MTMTNTPDQDRAEESMLTILGPTESGRMTKQTTEELGEIIQEYFVAFVYDNCWEGWNADEFKGAAALMKDLEQFHASWKCLRTAK